MKYYNGIVDFLFESALLKDVPRSGYHFLGGMKQSVAEHSFTIAVIGWCLAKLDPKADEARVIKMCLLHDIVEARTGDHNYVHKKYVKSNEAGAIADQAARLPFGGEYRRLTDEFKEARTREALLAKDADQIELLLHLKRALELGNKAASEWIYYAVKRLKTAPGKKIGAMVAKTRSDRWWFTSDEEWWVRGEKGCAKRSGSKKRVNRKIKARKGR